MEEQRFDDLARLVAQKTSRRQVLKVLAGAAIGGLFVRSGSGLALAKGPAKGPDCHVYCDQVFGKGTTAAKQCFTDARAGNGLCYSSCGPGGAGGTVCGGPSYGATTCCASGTSTCIAGTCCANASVCGSGTSAVCGCPSGQTCTNGTCTAVCTTTTPTCGGGTCTCPAGTVPITTGGNSGPTTTCVKSCTKDGDCAPGSYCTADPSGNLYCNDGGYAGFCATNTDCPQLTFCTPSANPENGLICSGATC
jgi:hypothetical protein